EAARHGKTKAQVGVIENVAVDESLARILPQHQTFNSIEITSVSQGPSGARLRRRHFSDALDAIPGIGMGREKTRHPLSLLFLDAVERLKESDDLAGVIASGD